VADVDAERSGLFVGEEPALLQPAHHAVVDHPPAALFAAIIISRYVADCKPTSPWNRATLEGAAEVAGHPPAGTPAGLGPDLLPVHQTGAHQPGVKSHVGKE
jgi:hypothetical protein